jgi:hypothetical protein
MSHNRCENCGFQGAPLCAPCKVLSADWTPCIDCDTPCPSKFCSRCRALYLLRHKKCAENGCLRRTLYQRCHACHRKTWTGCGLCGKKCPKKLCKSCFKTCPAAVRWSECLLCSTLCPKALCRVCFHIPGVCLQCKGNCSPFYQECRGCVPDRRKLKRPPLTRN